MSSRVSAAPLVQAVKELSLEWDLTRSYWRDVKSQEFEKKFLKELPHHVTRAREAITELDAVLGKVRSDCE
jgi:hypothetical protein